MTKFVSNSDFLKRYDARVVGELCSDTGSPVGAGSLATDPNLSIALEDASSQIMQHALKGGRYSEDDLNTLATDGDRGLQRMTCTVAMYWLIARRGKSMDDYPQYKNALDVLKELAEGKQVFNVGSVLAAGTAQSPSIPVQTVADNNPLQFNIRYFPVPRWTRQQLP